MKKEMFRIILLGILFSFVACSADNVLEPNLLGLYKFKSAHVDKPISVGNGHYIGDLILMKDKECYFDNTLEFQGERIILREGETACDNGQQKIAENEVISEFKYIYDKENQTIKIFDENGLIEILKNVRLGYSPDKKQTLVFELWNDEVEQVVRYSLETN